ncbi:MAG: hypothetical protein J5548_15930 [Prevotella sp.]|nr:hypothetical protein [Prevotella sp.]
MKKTLIASILARAAMMLLLAWITSVQVAWATPSISNIVINTGDDTPPKWQ